MQSTSHTLMIRPVNFAYNQQTAQSNAFQVTPATQQLQVQQQALAEFDAFVGLLTQNGVDVTVVNDTESPHTPDSIFPNNWISFHNDGSIYLYPMQAENRRLERRQDIIGQLGQKFTISTVTDLSHFEQQNKFLEGTGSMVLDRENKLAYACLSPRTDAAVLDEFSRISGYRSLSFHANDQNGKAIYHTNVMMCMGDRFCVICLESITDDDEREHVTRSLRSSGKTIIEITLLQMNHFAGNVLQLENNRGEALIVMSSRAWHALRPEQQKQLQEFAKPLFSPLDVIETNGGGSARCMIAEVHLPVK